MQFGNPIPGETPIDNVSGLRIKGISTRKELSVYEAENVRKAVVKYLSRKPSRRSARFDFTWCLRLHKEMFGDVWKWAGTLRTSDKTIGVPWRHVETRLYDLLRDLQFWEEKQSMPLLEEAVHLHHRAVQVHPFENGNGRWSRLLANVWLKQHGHAITEWPESTVGEQSIIRSEYLDAIRQADEGMYELLTELHRRYTASV